MFENGLEIIGGASHSDKVVWNDIVYQRGFACKKQEPMDLMHDF